MRYHRLLQRHESGRTDAANQRTTPAAARSLLNNRGRLFALRMASLPEGDQAGQLIGAPSEIGKRLVTWLEDTGRHETTSLREDTPLKADVIV